MGIHTHEATLNIQEDCALSFPVDEKSLSLLELWTLGFSIPKQFLEMAVCILLHWPLQMFFFLGIELGF